MPLTPLELPERFPFKDIFEQFLFDYETLERYWYVPKARTVNDANVRVFQEMLQWLDGGYEERLWTRDTQDALLADFRDLGLMMPTTAGSLSDRTALVRINMTMLEHLGLAWVAPSERVVITAAGHRLLKAQTDEERSEVLREQVWKHQYPSPSLTQWWAEEFSGLLPHWFLLSVLKELGGRISMPEYELFVNLAGANEDVGITVERISAWRQLTEVERQALMNVCATLARYRTISLDRSYQVAMFAFPWYLRISSEDGIGYITCVEQAVLDGLPTVDDLVLGTFESDLEWIAYYGDPEQQPSWYTYLLNAVESPIVSNEELDAIVAQNVNRLTPEQAAEIKKRQVERGIEDFYAENLSLIDPGLRLVNDGRQYQTAIGRIDLLCRDAADQYVVIELKAGSAEDAVFGQILRYIGWVHREMEGGRNNVRGIILAGEFPETARYSRFGLLRDDADPFLRFERHGFALESV